MFGVWKGKANTDLSQQSKEHVQEIAGYADFLKQYSKEFVRINGSISDVLMNSHIEHSKYVRSAYLEEGGDAFCDNPQLQDVYHCFLEFRSRIQQMETMEKQILETTIPQLLFMKEAFFPPGIPKPLRTKLTLQCGKEILFIQNAVSVFTDGLNLLFNTIDLLQQRMNDSTSEVSNHFMQNSKPMNKTSTISLRMKSSSRGISVLHLYLLPYQPIFISLMRFLSALLTLHTVAAFLPSVFDSLRTILVNQQKMEEAEVILTNWSVVSSSSLFSHPSEFLLLPFQLSSGFLQIGSLVLQQQVALYVKSFSSVVSIAGLTGMILILSQSPNSDDCSSLQNARSLLADHCHGESIFGGVNAYQCEGVTNVIHSSLPPFGDVEKRLKHKDTYGHQISELCFVLSSLSSSHSCITPSIIVNVICDAISLYHRIRMSLEAYLFTYRVHSSHSLSYSLLTRQLLRLHSLYQALLDNQSLQLLLPLLLNQQLASLTEALDCSSSVKDYLKTHSTESSTLLWLSFVTGRDIFCDHYFDITHHIILLQDLLAAYRGKSWSNSHIFFSNAFLFKDLLSQPRDASQSTLLLQALVTSVNDSSTLYQALAEPRKSILSRGLFYSVYYPLFDQLVGTVQTEIDNIIRKHVFLHDYRIPEEVITVSVRGEQLLKIAQIFTHFPSFTLLHTSVDFYHLITELYSRSHYNTMVSYTIYPSLVDLIHAYVQSLFTITLTDPCLLPEKQIANDEISVSKALRHGNGLFGVDYNRLEQYVYVMSERSLLASAHMEVGCVSASADVIFVKDTQVMQKYIQEQNRDELLDSIYRTASAMEILLLEIISTVHEDSVESLCDRFYSSLFENGHFLYPSIPAELLSQIETQLDTLDAGLMKNLTLAVDRFAILLVLMQYLDQNSTEAREMRIFSDILKNFQLLCRKDPVNEEIVLIFVIMLYQQTKRNECVLAPIFGDNIPYGVASLLQLLGLVVS